MKTFLNEITSFTTISTQVINVLNFLRKGLLFCIMNYILILRIPFSSISNDELFKSSYCPYVCMCPSVCAYVYDQRG